ncbi:PREDICTED: uncharacterized protein LOC108559842 [Nicrophorus vespilloides]|uniref:Uncharacterized protein LOC108559842 n=1 Tax=Nicrophorus vespilloides TaxID=110193 RepID=A0ABM1MDP7_NICVS|nr:PREDICTED: uncharacterized protein LOC108559842 [Nicrophorus vespilloides]
MDFIKLPIFTYALVKHKLQNDFKLSKNQDMPFVIINVLLTLAALLVAIPVVLILCMYKYLISFILYMKYDKKYRYIMPGIDSFCNREYRCLINSVLFVEYKKSPSELLEDLRERINNVLHGTHEKISFTRHRFMGLDFYLKRDFNVEELVRPMIKGECTQLSSSAFAEIISIEDKLVMPGNDMGMFEVSVGQQPMAEDVYNSSNVYPILFRMHHSLCDGISFINAFYTTFIDNELPAIEKSMKDKIIENMIDLKLATQTTTIKNNMFSLRDHNSLRGYNLLEDKHFVWTTKLNSEILLKVKKIRKYYGTSFASTITACLTSSLHEHLAKSNEKIPDTILAGLVVLPKPCTFQWGKMRTEFVNEFGAVAIQLPISVDSVKNPIVTRIKLVQKEYETIQKTIDCQLNYWFIKFLIPMLPAPVTDYLKKIPSITMGISNLPGGPEFSLFNDDGKVIDNLNFPPNSTGTGIHVAIITYGSYLRLSITVDKSVVRKFTDVQEILDNTTKYIEDLADNCK